MTMIRTFLLSILLVALPAAADVSPLWPKPDPGPHQVGFKALPHGDHRRASLPWMISVWYPAQTAPGRHPDDL